MRSVIGDTFQGKNGDVELSDIIANNQVVALFFSAYWCPPCRNFAPLLTAFYNEVNDPDKRFEVIFVSSDKEQSQFDEYYATMPWLTIPYGDPRIAALKSQFKVQGIPIMVLLNKDGTMAYGAARADVVNEDVICFERWVELIK